MDMVDQKVMESRLAGRLNSKNLFALPAEEIKVMLEKLNKSVELAARTIWFRWDKIIREACS
jgi:hypothetical protein